MSLEIVMPHRKAQAFVLPYEPNYTGHRQPEGRRRRSPTRLRRWAPSDQPHPSIVPEDVEADVERPTKVSSK
jgi:hypothetical protein